MKQRILKENKNAFLFLSDPRKVPGHFLVSSKRHVEKPWLLTSDEIKDIFELVFFTQKRLTEKISKGADVRQNYRPFLKQSTHKIDHVHYHVIPRDLFDDLYERVEKHETAMFEPLSNAEHDKMAKLIED